MFQTEKKNTRNSSIQQQLQWLFKYFIVTINQVLIYKSMTLKYKLN